jgi:ferritin
MNSLIKGNYDKVMHEYENVFADFPWENRFAYAMWLKQTLFFVQRSTRLISLAGSRFPLEREHFHQRFIDHSKEEKGHDKMLIKDIKSLGYTLDDLKVLDTTKTFLFSQFYWIEHVNPISFFGYILFLEGLAITHAKTVIQKVSSSFGNNSHLFLRVHAEEDIEHMNKAFNVVSEASTEEVSQIIENMNINASLYKYSLTEIKNLIKDSELKFNKRAG